MKLIRKDHYSFITPDLQQLEELLDRRVVLMVQYEQLEEEYENLLDQYAKAKDDIEALDRASKLLTEQGLPCAAEIDEELKFLSAENEKLSETITSIRKQGFPIAQELLGQEAALRYAHHWRSLNERWKQALYRAGHLTIED